MSKFTSSFGIEVYMEGGALYIGNPPLSPLTRAGVQALREFFQHERDQELGRWRSPLGFYVYPLGEDDGARIVLVLDESTGQTQTYFEGAECTGPGILYEAANDYFAAHPVPKPWHDAKPGEVWVLTFSNEGGGGIGPWQVSHQNRFESSHYITEVKITDSTIIDGRRIWPEA